jgi:hypothetical protein
MPKKQLLTACICAAFLLGGIDRAYAQAVNLSWKAIYYEGFFNLYVIVNNDTYYYAGNFYGSNFDTNKNADIENALGFFRGTWAGSGSRFYVYRKSDAELALMHQEFSYALAMLGYGWPVDGDKEFKELLVIDIGKGSRITIEEKPVIIRPLSGRSL